MSNDPVSRPPHRLRLLGEPAVGVDAAALQPLERHDAALLALLVLEGPQPRPRLAHLLWPDAPAAKALSSLRQRLYRLRRNAGDLLGGDDGPVRLASTVSHDLHPAQAAAGACDFELLGALHYPEGEPLAEQVQAMRERWRAALWAALEQAADRLEGQQAYDEALHLTERLLPSRWTSEHLHRRCMRLHYLRGDRAQALAAYARCRDKLRTLLGLAPDEQTESLARLIEAGSLSGRDARWATPRVALAQPPQVVGREQVWSLLDSACREPMLVIIRGEPGIGKSRLAGDFVQARGPCLMVKARETEQDSPFALLGRLLNELQRQGLRPPVQAVQVLARLREDHCPASTPAPEPQQRRQALFDALAPLAARSHSTLLIDDLQWADAASLELLLDWLARRMSERMQAVILCLRDGDAPPALAPWLQTRAAGTVLELKLGPLDAAGVAELLAGLQLPTIPTAALAEAAASLLRQTGGHPFVLLELLRAMPDAWARQGRSNDEPADDRVLQLLQRRIAQLAPDAQRVATVSALADADYGGALAAQVLDLRPQAVAQAWAHLTEAQLVQADGTMFDLAREAVLRSLPPALARSLHQRIATALSALAAARPEVLARHWLAAQSWPQAANAFAEAAGAAARQARRVEELAFWDQAADCHERADDDAAGLKARLSALQAALLVESGDVLAARISSLASRATEPQARLDLLLAQSRALLNASDGQAALEPSRQALHLAGVIADPRRQLAATGWHGLALALCGRHREGLDLLRSAEAGAAAERDDATRLGFFGSLGYTLFLSGAYADALQAIAVAAELAERSGDLGEAVEQVINVSTCLNLMGRTAESLAEGERALTLWRRLGEPRSVTAVALHAQLGMTYSDRGRFRQALDLLNGALEGFRQTGAASWATVVEHRLATLYLRLGQPARARQALAPLLGDADPGRRATRAIIECELAALAGSPSLERLQTLEQELADQLAPVDRRYLRLALARHQDAETSLATALQVLDDARSTQDGPAAIHAHARAADACRRLGRFEQATEQARCAWSSGSGAAALGLDRPTLCWLVYQAATAGGDSQTARAALDGGVSWIADTLPHVPEAFRSSFCHRNPVNRHLLAANTRVGVNAPPDEGSRSARGTDAASLK